MNRIEPKIFLRQDQTIDCLSKNYHDSNVLIVAPDWVKEGLNQLSQFIPQGTEFPVYENNNPSKIKSIIIKNELTLKDLIVISRNEPVNVSGRINYKNYEPIFSDANKNVIYSIKDLARQCVIVARDKTTNYGGYPKGQNPITKQNEQVYIVDLIGLQFQNKFNSGRLVLIGNNLPEGLLDDLIFEKVVGEKKKSFKEASEDKSKRYLQHNEVYFDTIAYKKFVETDVLISGLALNIIANKSLNFKFLKYGTGFFAGIYSSILEE